MGLLDFLNSASGPASALGTAQQQERARQNLFADARGGTLADIFRTQIGAQTSLYGNQGQQQTSQYGTNQQALMQALLGASNEGQGNAVIDLNRRKFALDAPSTRASQAVRGSLLQTARPSTLSGGSARLQAHTPTITGGANDPLGPGARDAGRLLESGALAGLRSGDTFDPLPQTDFQGGVLKPPGILAAPSAIAPPSLPGYQGAGGLETALGALGLAPGIINALKKLFRGGGNAVPGSGVEDDWQGPEQDPPEWQGPIQTSDGDLTGETGGRLLPGNLGDPTNPDWQGPPDPEWWETPNPYTWGSGVDTTPPDDWQRW